MELNQLVNRPSPPSPWSEGDNIPWHDPAFSRRMLDEHLSQDHDAASRRCEKIQNHVQWINHHLLLDQPAKILDLACGPGLYSSRLAELGHECFGIDYSPASIEYARNAAEQNHLSCKYVHQDIRQADYGIGFNLVMLVYGELNIFAPDHAHRILTKAHTALANDGLILLEPHTFSIVQEVGNKPASWYSAQSGLFSDNPHICLQENFWDESSRTATIRYFIIDSASAIVTPHAQTLQAYTDHEYHSLLTESGFSEIQFHPSLSGDEQHSQQGLVAIVARKRRAS